MKIFGREPALWLGVISAALSLSVTLGISDLNREAAGAIVSTIAATGMAATAFMTRPIAPSAFAGIVAVYADLMAAFHYEVGPGTVGAVNAAVLAVMTLLTRGQVSPKPARTDR